MGDREYSFFQGRFYGRVSEIIFNVWLMNQKEEIKEIPYIHMEEIDWKKKGMAFLKAKFGKRIRREVLGEDYAIQDNKKRSFFLTIYTVYMIVIAPVTDCV